MCRTPRRRLPRPHRPVQDRPADDHARSLQVEGATATFYASGGLLAEAAARGDIVCFEADRADSELRSVVVIGKLRLMSPEFHARPDQTSTFGTAKVSSPMTIVSGRAATTPVSTSRPITAGVGEHRDIQVTGVNGPQFG